MSNFKLEEELKKLQTQTLKDNLPKALNYHFSNFKKLEKLARPRFDKDEAIQEDRRTVWESLTTIKFEIQAYLCQLRRVKHFIQSPVIRSLKINEPTDPEIKEVWNAIIKRDGMINALANKWAAHRSYDDPEKDDDDSVHAEVLMNLDGGVTMWEEDHMFLAFGKHHFNLCYFHPKVEKFLSWIFQEIENKLQVS